MPNDPGESIQVEYTPEFKRNLRVLSKKYRHIRSDIQPIIEQLQRREIIGNQIPGMHHTIFKVRIRGEKYLAFFLGLLTFQKAFFEPIFFHAR